MIAAVGSEPLRVPVALEWIRFIAARGIQQRIARILVTLDVQLRRHVVRQVKQLLVSGHGQQQCLGALLHRQLGQRHSVVCRLDGAAQGDLPDHHRAAMDRLAQQRAGQRNQGCGARLGSIKAAYLDRKLMGARVR